MQAKAILLRGLMMIKTFIGRFRGQTSCKRCCVVLTGASLRRSSMFKLIREESDVIYCPLPSHRDPPVSLCRGRGIRELSLECFKMWLVIMLRHLRRLSNQCLVIAKAA